jgi:CBS domain-containing protein
MTTQIASAKPGTTLRQAANLMRGRLIGSLPVVSDGRVVGIVTATDVLEELGRGSTRPAAAAQRRSMRLPPMGARSAAARKSGRAKRAIGRTRKSTRKSGKLSKEPLAVSVPALTGRITPTLGRGRVRVPDSTRRAPMSSSIPRPLKTQAGRTNETQISAYIRGVGTALDAADHAYLRRKLGMKLGKFARSIERVSVRVGDVNGPRGGIDHRCRIKVVLKGLPSAVVEQQHPSLQGAMDGALERTARTVRRTLQRRRTRRRDQVDGRA